MKDWKGRNYTFDFTDPSKPIRTFRARDPSHLVFEIESYSKLLTSLQAGGVKAFETPEFDAGGTKWVLCIYPNGRNNSSYLSLYLKRPIVRGGPRNAAVYVTMKFFIKDYESGEYLVIEDLGERNFNVGAKEWGIPQALEKNHFEKPENGFLFEDRCTFGAEVFITTGEPHFTKMSYISSVPKRNFFLQFGPFTPQTPEPVSQTFTTELDGESYTWKLILYRQGYDAGVGSHYSLFLELDSKDKVANKRSLFVNYKISLRNKTQGYYDNEKSQIVWYTDTNLKSGFPQYIGITDLYGGASSGYTTYNDNSISLKVDFDSFFVLGDMEG